MNLIAVDIGNSSVSLGLFADDELARTERLGHAQLDRLGKLLTELCRSCGPAQHDARTLPVVVSSVNTDILVVLEAAAATALEQRILLIGRDVPLTIKLALEEPASVGTDRLLTAGAAYDMLQTALVVADFGSAITVDCVNHPGIFLGGAILPGLTLAACALNEHTAALPLIEPTIPPGDLGTNTAAAIQHGIYYGAIGALRQLVERYAAMLGRWPHVVLTGGHARIVAEHCDFVDSVVDNLCLTGIYLAYVKFAAPSQDNPPS